MGQLLLILAVALVVGVIVFGVAVLITGSDPGLEPAEPDGQALPLPTHRPLGEADLSRVRFDLAVRGYRMSQVDQALRRAGYDIGYKDELISVLEAEVNALRSGRTEDAEAMRRAREAALAGTADETATPAPAADAGVVDLGLVSGGPQDVPVVIPRSGPVADLVPGTPPPADTRADAGTDEQPEKAQPATEDATGDEVAEEAMEDEVAEEAMEDEVAEEAMEDEVAEADAADSDAPPAAEAPAGDAPTGDVPAAQGDAVPGTRR